MLIFRKPDILCLTALLAAGLFLFSACTAENARKSDSGENPPELVVEETRQMFTDGFPSQREKHQVVRWLMLNSLNKYGDPMGTMYSGSTPLYNEATGEIISRYEYLVKKHPGKPWLKIQVDDPEN